MRDPNCIFCKLVAGEIPSYKVYEDDDFLAFIDIHPLSTGHCQVIPKEHCRWVWDVQNAGAYFEVVKKIALAQKKAFETEQILVKIDGSDVFHAHIWVWPHEKIGDPKDFEGNAERIKKYLT